MAGFYRGAFDQVIMRLTDAWLSFPFLILAIGLVTILGPVAHQRHGGHRRSAPRRPTSGSRAASCWPRSEEDYVQGARALGAGDLRVMARHILPNIASALLVQATVSIPGAIIAEAILSFLGLGVQPPTPSWGTMLNTAQQFLETRAVDGLVAGPRDLLARRCRSTWPATACATGSTRGTRRARGA